jgi:phytoene synthase
MDDIVDDAQEHHIAEKKLDWWVEEVDRMYQNKASHPIAQAIAPHTHSFRWQKNWFDEVILGMRMDLQKNTYASFDELSIYTHRVAGVVGYLSAEVFGYQEKQTLDYAHALGVAFQLTNIIRDVGEDLRRGRCYIPLDELDDAGVDWEAFSTRYENSPAFEALMHQQVQRARQQYTHAFSLLAQKDRHNQKTGLIMAAVYQRLLDELEDDGLGHVLHQKLSLTWRSKLGAILPVLCSRT